MNRVIRKAVPIERNGVHAEYSIEKVGEHYEVHVDLGYGFNRIYDAAVTHFEKPAKGTIAAYAEEWAKRLVDGLIAASERPARFVVIEDFPGFAEKRLGKHVRGGYWMDHQRGVPTYVVRVETAVEGDKIIERVERMSTIVDGGRTFAPKVTKVTDNPVEAVEGNEWHADDASTYLAVRRANANANA